MLSTRLRHLFLQAFPAIALGMPHIANAEPASPPPPLPAEVSDVLRLAPNHPHRFFTMTWQNGVIIFNVETGKIEGQVPAHHGSNVRTAADGSKIYISETLWTHGNRGERLDLLSIYDGSSLDLQKEIQLPGRLLVGNKLQDLELSASGRRAYVYNMHPASSVVWVDLTKQAIGGSVETPGCALIFPWGESGFSSLCSDGSLATVSIPEQGAAKVTHTKPFFDAANDPIFDNSIADRASNRAVFLSYTGLIYTATLSETPVIDKPWSLQQAAGQKAAGTGVEELAWRPGGVQPLAWHKASGRLFVLMHPGNYWSHHDGGTEIWVLDLKSHALLKRFPVLNTPDSTQGEPRNYATRGIAVTQQGKPQLMLMNSKDGDTVMDADSGEVLKKIDASNAGSALVPGS